MEVIHVNKEWLAITTELVLDPNNLLLWEKLVVTAEKNQKKGINKASSEEEIEILRTSYESLLEKYPLLYNYWIKYAVWEFKLGNIDKANEIYQTGLQPLGYCIELWVSYLQFKMKTISNNLDEVLVLFEQARLKIGYHFHSYDFYKIYLQFLKNYQDIIPNYQLKYYVLLRIIVEIPLYHYEYFFKILFDIIAEIGKSQDLKQQIISLLVPKSELNSFLKFDLKSTSVQLKKIFVDVYITTQFKVYELFNFEKKITKPYFDNEYVSQQQLGNWDRYLDFLELKEYPRECIALTYERCLIPTAAYCQFWIKYADYFIVEENYNQAAACLVKGCFYSNDYKLIVKLIDVHIYLHEFLRAKDIIVQYIKQNIFIPIPIYEKLLNLERLINDDDEYITNLFKELIKETNNEWFFEHILYYSIPYELKNKLFKEFETNFQNSVIYQRSLEKLQNFHESISIFPEIDYEQELKSYI